MNAIERPAQLRRKTARLNEIQPEAADEPAVALGTIFRSGGPDPLQSCRRAVAILCVKQEPCGSERDVRLVHQFLCHPSLIPSASIVRIRAGLAKRSGRTKSSLHKGSG